MDEEQASIAGVSLDEEMTNLIRFQHSYQASARIVGTVQEMMDTLMNM
jgi:flagellar hook-associated protein 1 FlgK